MQAGRWNNSFLNGGSTKISVSAKNNVWVNEKYVGLKIKSILKYNRNKGIKTSKITDLLTIYSSITYIAYNIIGLYTKIKLIPLKNTRRGSRYYVRINHNKKG